MVRERGRLRCIHVTQTYLPEYMIIRYISMSRSQVIVDNIYIYIASYKSQDRPWPKAGEAGALDAKLG